MVRYRDEQVTKSEKKILAEIQKNAQESFNSIGKRCSFSRQKVWRIVKKMEADHLIWGYVAIADDQKQGIQRYILCLKRSTQNMDEELKEQLASYRFSEELFKLGITIEDCYFVSDEYDWVIVFTAQDVVTAKRFTNLILTKYPGTISKLKISQVLKTLRHHQVINPDKIDLREIL